MKKKKCIFILFIITTCILVLYLCRFNYINIYSRIVSCINKGSNLETYGDINIDKYYQFLGNFYYYIGYHFVEFCKNFNSWNSFLNGLLILLVHIILFISNILIYSVYLIYILIFLFVFRKIYINSSNDNYKVSKGAKILIKVVSSIRNHFVSFKEFVCSFYKKNIRDIKIASLCWLFSSGVLFVVLNELIIYLVQFVISLFMKTQMEYSIRLLVAFLGFFINLIVESSFATKILICIAIFFYLTISRSYRRLEWNKQQRIDSIFGVAGTLNLFQGFPSAGKTKTISILTQDAEEQMVEELEQTLLDLEEQYPEFNIAYLIFLLNLKFKFYNEQDVYDILSHNDQVLKDIQLLDKYLSDDVKYYVEYVFKLLYVRGSFMASNYAIIDPLFDNYEAGEDGYHYSHSLDMNAFRWYQKINKMYFEPYMAIAIQEMDKEFNSHKDMKQINEEGTAVAFSAITHVCQRHVYIFADYQLKDQVPARIRGNASAQIKIVKTSSSYPFWIKIFRFIVCIPYNHLKNVIVDFRIIKVKSESKGLRYKPMEYKRNDVSLYYQVLKYLCAFFGKIVSYLETFRFTRFECLYSYKDSFDGPDCEELIYYINDCELSFKGHKIYESCNLGNFFDELKCDKNDASDINDLPYWESLNPGYKFYVDNVHQHFYEDMVNAQLSKDTLYDSSTNVQRDESFGEDVIQL